MAISCFESYYIDGIRLGLDAMPRHYAIFSGREFVCSSRSWTQIVHKLTYLSGLRDKLRIDVITSQSQYTLWDYSMMERN